jgi:glycolate oxidase iron-sulfur subunit
VPQSAEPLTTELQRLSAELQRQTDRCVMCGMCSQHCPTYALTGDENESPRGRIALISALNSGRLELDDRLAGHLEHCTGCRACEDYCPSDVAFGAIMDTSRALLAPQRPLSPRQQRFMELVTQPRRLARLGRWLVRYQHWGLQRLARASGLLRLFGLAEAESLLPRLAGDSITPGYSPALDEHRGDVALFTGCVSSLVDRAALHATCRLLNRLGYGVHVPAQQTCCGALHQHGGQPDVATALAHTNLEAFAGLDIQAIVHTATGCTSMLTEYAQLLNTEDAKAFADRVLDINQFLAQADWPAGLSVQPLSGKLAVHEPCSARNVLHQAEAPYTLLQRIPGLEVMALPGNARCCGASGGQLLEATDFARRLREDKLEAAATLDIHTLVTTNVGCALHLAAGLRQRGLTVEVLHPVTLLLRQIEAQG